MADSMDKKFSNVPILRFPEFNDEWKLTSYNLLFEFQNGINGSPEKYGKGIKYISVMDILNNQYITYSNIKGLIDATEKEQQNFMVGYGDVLFQRSSETPEDAGKSNVYLDSKPCVFGGFVIRGKKIGNYNPIFIKYALASNANRKKMIRLGAGAQHINIGQNNLNSLKISLPSEFEQEKIALLFDAIDKKIETQNKIIRDLNSYKNSIIDSFFKKCTDFVSLDKILYERKKYSEKGANYEHVTLSKDGIVPKGERYDRDFLVKDASKEYKITKLNDICYNPANLKFGVICLNDYGDAIFSPIYVTFEVNQAFDPFYVSLYLTSNKFINYILKYQQGTVYERMAVGPNDFVKAKLPICNNISTFTNLIKVINNKIKIEMNLLEKYMLQKTYLSESLFI